MSCIISIPSFVIYDLVRDFFRYYLSICLFQNNIIVLLEWRTMKNNEVLQKCCPNTQVLYACILRICQLLYPSFFSSLPHKYNQRWITNDQSYLERWFFPIVEIVSKSILVITYHWTLSESNFGKANTCTRLSTKI